MKFLNARDFSRAKATMGERMMECRK